MLEQSQIQEQIEPVVLKINTLKIKYRQQLQLNLYDRLQQHPQMTQYKALLMMCPKQPRQQSQLNQQIAAVQLIQELGGGWHAPWMGSGDVSAVKP